MLWYTDDSIAARGPSPQLHADCQSWCEATAESDCNVRASALTGDRVRCGYDGVDQRCVLFVGMTLTKSRTNVATRWATSSDCKLLNKEAMLCDDGEDGEKNAIDIESVATA